MKPGYQEQILYILNKHHSIVTIELGDAVTDDILQLIDQARKEAARKAAIKELKEITKYPTAVIIDGHFEKKTLIYIKDIQDRIKALKEGK